MHPELYGHTTYPLFLALASVIGSGVAIYVARQAAAVRLGSFLGVLVILTVTALLGAKLYSVVERGTTDGVSAELQGGYRYPGGLLGFVAGLVLIGRSRVSGIRLLLLGDIFAPSFAFGLAAVRLGCFLQHENQDRSRQYNRLSQNAGTLVAQSDGNEYRSAALRQGQRKANQCKCEARRQYANTAMVLRIPGSVPGWLLPAGCSVTHAH